MKGKSVIPNVLNENPWSFDSKKKKKEKKKKKGESNRKGLKKNER